MIFSDDIITQNALNMNFNPYGRGLLRQVHISDIHFGVIDPLTEFNILKEQFIDKIISIANCLDVISINGDLFDHKVMANSPVVLYATKFISMLIDICTAYNITLIIIAGTKSHDNDQLQLFYHYIQESNADIRIIESVSFEIVKGAKILCIPELYGMGEEYYNNFLSYSGNYDAVFMHGTVKGSVY